jgi:hypothetical protein
MDIKQQIYSWMSKYSVQNYQGKEMLMMKLGNIADNDNTTALEHMQRVLWKEATWEALKEQHDTDHRPLYGSHFRE